MNSIRQTLRSALIGLLATLACLTAFALESDRTIDQFTHTAWKAMDGGPSDIRAIEQTADGSLWLASSGGLVRFDGTTFERFEPQSGPALPTGAARSLLALANGDLWVGFFSGTVTLLRNGQATNYTQRDGVPNGKANGRDIGA